MKCCLRWDPKSLVLSLAAIASICATGPQVIAAEEIIFSNGSPLELDVSLEALEEFANGAEPKGNLKFITKGLSSVQLRILRAGMNQRVNIEPASLYKATNNPVGEFVLQQVGAVIQGDLSEVNHWKAIRGSMIISAADEEEGLTLINVIRNYPLDTVRIDVRSLQELTSVLPSLPF